jgi:hypothetical protein
VIEAHERCYVPVGHSVVERLRDRVDLGYRHESAPQDVGESVLATITQSARCIHTAGPKRVVAGSPATNPSRS